MSEQHSSLRNNIIGLREINVIIINDVHPRMAEYLSECTVLLIEGAAQPQQDTGDSKSTTACPCGSPLVRNACEGARAALRARARSMQRPVHLTLT